jgi:hypothetical protein
MVEKVKNAKASATDGFVGWLVVFEPKPGLTGNSQRCYETLEKCCTAGTTEGN